MSKEEKIIRFNPNDPATEESNIFGLPFNKEEAAIVLLPLPWEVTVSFNAGTANAPDLIFDASHQVDLFDPYINEAWKIGVFMDEVNKRGIEVILNEAHEQVTQATCGYGISIDMDGIEKMIFKRSLSMIPPRVSSLREIGKLKSVYPCV